MTRLPALLVLALLPLSVAAQTPTPEAPAAPEAAAPAASETAPASEAAPTVPAAPEPGTAAGTAPDTAAGTAPRARAAEAPFAALAAALSAGAPGTPESARLTWLGGCRVLYELESTVQGLPVSGRLELDVAGLRPGSASVDSANPPNIRYRGSEGFYSATISADPAEAARFEAITGQACDAEGCRATLATPELYLTVVGHAAEERATRAIAAMTAFHGRCAE
jgi:hypothetical protein